MEKKTARRKVLTVLKFDPSGSGCWIVDMSVCRKLLSNGLGKSGIKFGLRLLTDAFKWADCELKVEQMEKERKEGLTMAKKTAKKATKKVAKKATKKVTKKAAKASK